MESKSNLKIVIILLVIIMVITGGFCSVIYLNKVLPVKINLEGFEKSSEQNGLIKIDDISETGNNYRIDGSFIKPDIGKYKLYVSIDDLEGNIKYYKTQINSEDNTFFTIIRKSMIKSKSKIGVLYMCDNEKIIIETNNIIGGEND